MEATKEDVKEAEVMGQFIGGKVVIEADPRTGGIMVSAPSNMIVSFGLLEIAKQILADRQKEGMRKDPAVKIPTAADLAALNRRPS